jgi:hypothetical protein
MRTSTAGQEGKELIADLVVVEEVGSMVGARDDQESLVGRSRAIHGTRVIDVWRVLAPGDKEQGHMRSRHRTPGGETLEIARPGKTRHAADF